MSLLLTGISALEYWRFAAHTHRLPYASVSASLDKPTIAEARTLSSRGYDFLSLPVQVLVPTEASRCRHAGLVCRVDSIGLSYESVVRIGDGLFVVLPQVCFSQLAGILPFPNLVEVGFELCGCYAQGVRGFDDLVSRDPLIGVAELVCSLERLGSTANAKTARQAARYLLDGSMSPMETINVEFLCFPFRLGGYSLPFPVMNAIIKVPPRDRPFVKKSYYKCDLYWPEARFAIEYDSNLHHTGATRIAEDASRRTDLAYLGVEVATLTQQQAYDRREMDRIARLLAKRLGVRLRMERVNPAGAQDDLRGCLLARGKIGQGNGFVEDI